jgi:hypothetical protein
LFAALGEPLERWSAGVTQAEQFRGLVESLPRGVVERFAEHLVLAHAAYAHQLGMAAGNQKRGEREVGRIFLKQRREQMALEVVHTDRGNAQAEREAVRDSGSDQQRPGKSRALGERDGIQVRGLGAGSLQHRAHQRKHAPNVIARCELRYHPAVLVVEGHLRVQRMGEKAPVAVVDGHPAFVARGLDTKHPHDFEGFSLTSVSPMSGTFK